MQVRFNDSRDTLAVIECKGTSGITPKGGKTFTLKKDVLDQMVKEANHMKAIGLVWVHWLNASYVQDDYVIMKSEHFLKLLELAKDARTEVVDD